MWLLWTSRSAQACFHEDDRDTREQAETCKSSWDLGLKLVYHIFYLILLGKKKKKKQSHRKEILCLDDRNSKVTWQLKGIGRDELLGPWLQFAIGQTISTTGLPASAPSPMHFLSLETFPPYTWIFALSPAFNSYPNPLPLWSPSWLQLLFSPHQNWESSMWWSNANSDAVLPVSKINGRQVFMEQRSRYMSETQ